MRKINNKAFTLIELLAVILILAIIALIAVPTVSSIIKESKKNAFKQSVTNVNKVIETQCQLEQMRGEDITLTYNIKDGIIDQNISIKGDIPKYGIINVDDDCNVSIYVSSGDFCAFKELESNVLLVGTVKDGECVLDEDENEENSGGSGSGTEGGSGSDGGSGTGSGGTGAGESCENSGGNGTYICRRATTLHTEICEEDTSYYGRCTLTGYYPGGSKGTTTITYGNIGTRGKLTSGDAFDCDVNGDGTYDPVTERFYYVSDYYNTRTDKFESDKAVLAYYNNTVNGVANDSKSSSIAYYSADDANNYGPVTAVKYLPTTTQWKNVSLIENNRYIVDDELFLGDFQPYTFNYSGYAARLLTIQEVVDGCELVTDLNVFAGSMEVCTYLMENTYYAKLTSNEGYWLESPHSATDDSIWIIRAASPTTFSDYTKNMEYKNSVRPAIELYKTEMEIC